MQEIELQKLNQLSKTNQPIKPKSRSSFFLSAVTHKTTIIQEEICLQKFVISIHNHYKSIWDFYTLLLSCYSCITMAYYAGFGMPADNIHFYLIIVVEICFFIDLVLKFFTEYRDPENFEYVNDIRKIVKHYLAGWFIIDLVALFPFTEITSVNLAYLKLLRLIRFPEIFDLLDQSKIAEPLLERYTRQNKTNYISASKYVYKIFKLLIFAILLTYFMGCFWYWLTVNVTNDPGDNTFYNDYFGYNISDSRKLIICCYFVLTTLATVGYGDFMPQSDEEKIFAIIIMIVGIALFSHIMGNFGDVLANYEKEMGTIDKSSNLQAWIDSMRKLNQDNPLPHHLISAIDDHFTYCWKNDRLSTLTQDDPYLQQLPNQLKFQLIRHLFEDIFDLFKGPLLTLEFMEIYETFYYELAFILMPRKYEPGKAIINQGDSFDEIYLIKEGHVIVSLNIQNTKIAKSIGVGSCFGLRNIFSPEHSLSQYTYSVYDKTENPLKIFAISKVKLLKLLDNYEEIKVKMFDQSLKIESALQKGLKTELRIRIEKINPTISLRQIMDYFNEEIKKYQIETHTESTQDCRIDNKLGTAEITLEGLIDKMDDFNKNIGDQLETVISHFNKLREQITTKTRDNNSLQISLLLFCMILMRMWIYLKQFSMNHIYNF